jgi:hypothetical protein
VGCDFGCALSQFTFEQLQVEKRKRLCKRCFKSKVEGDKLCGPGKPISEAEARKDSGPISENKRIQVDFEIVFPKKRKTGAGAAAASLDVDADAQGGAAGSDEASADDGRPSPYISLYDGSDDIHHMKHGDEIVIPQSSITLIVKYPMTRPHEFVLTAPSSAGFTRGELARQICLLYQRIYREENKTTLAPPAMIPGLLNRGPTSGRYGIRMHELGDLLLHTVSQRGDGKFTLGIDS